MRGFFSRILGRNTDEDETRILSREEIGKRVPGKEASGEELQGFTVERAARIIDDLPPEVPQESAVRIVRGTLVAAGIEIEDIKKSARARESKLNSEIEFARGRQEDLRKRTEEVVRSLEEEKRKAREARDTGIAQEEENISRAVRGLEETGRVRAFFGFPEAEQSIDAVGAPSRDDTRSLEPSDADETQVMRRPRPLAGGDEPAADEGPSTHGASYGTTDER